MCSAVLPGIEHTPTSEKFCKILQDSGFRKGIPRFLCPHLEKLAAQRAGAHQEHLRGVI